jgi:hypothetical protein
MEDEGSCVNNNVAQRFIVARFVAGYVQQVKFLVWQHNNSNTLTSAGKSSL